MVRVRIRCIGRQIWAMVYPTTMIAQGISQTALGYHFDARPAGTGGCMHADVPYLSFQSRMLSFLLPNASFYISQVLLTH